VTTVLFLWSSDIHCSLFLLVNAVVSILCQVVCRQKNLLMFVTVESVVHTPQQAGMHLEGWFGRCFN
jgi:hypothetical protein